MRQGLPRKATKDQIRDEGEPAMREPEQRAGGSQQDRDSEGVEEHVHPRAHSGSHQERNGEQQKAATATRRSQLLISST